MIQKILKKISENISKIILIAIILLTTLIIGRPIDINDTSILYMIIAVFSIVYYIIKKEKIIKNKIDILIVILCLSAIIPLIFGTYVSLSGTVNSIIKYVCALNIFLIAKRECEKNPKNKNIILNTIIISILLLCVIGIDEILGNNLNSFRGFIGANYKKIEGNRLLSLFAYANAMAVVAGAGIFLCIGYVFESKKMKTKLLYIVISIIMLITMLLTYSRLVYLVFAVMCIFFGLVLCKKYNIKQKINKKVILVISLILLTLVIYTIIGLQITEGIKIEKEYEKAFFNMQPNTEYTFVFDINAITNINENYIIEIIEKNEYADEINTTELEFGTFSGIKEVKIHTKEETDSIYVCTENKQEQGKLEIKGISVNGEDIVLKYKLLPTGLVNRIKEIDFSDKSSWERITFIKDAIKQIKNNWLFGLGGNAWRTVQLESQEYNYYANEVHSFPIQIFLENGIVAIIAYLAIGVYIIKYLYKELKKPEMDMLEICKIIALLCILIHSMLDFGMSFFYILLVVFLIIATMQKENNEIQNKTANIIIKSVLIILCIIIVYIAAVEKHFEDHKDNLVVNQVWTEEKIYNTYNKLIPFNKQVKFKKYEILNRQDNVEYEKVEKVLKDIIKTEKYNIQNLNLENIYSYIEASTHINVQLDKNIQIALNYIYNTEEFYKYNVDCQMRRFANMKKIIEILQKENKIEYASKVQEQLEKEINAKAECILDYKKCRYSKEHVEEISIKIMELKQIEKLY